MFWVFLSFCKLSFIIFFKANFYLLFTYSTLCSFWEIQFCFAFLIYLLYFIILVGFSIWFINLILSSCLEFDPILLFINSTLYTTFILLYMYFLFISILCSFHRSYSLFSVLGYFFYFSLFHYPYLCIWFGIFFEICIWLCWCKNPLAPEKLELEKSRSPPGPAKEV